MKTPLITKDKKITLGRRFRRRLTLDGFEPTLTKQEFGDACDINAIVARHGVRAIADSAPKNPVYGDFSSVPDYQSAQNVVAKANEQFAALPSGLREKFSNDPSKFLAFVSDPDNESHLVKYGLAKKREQLNERDNVPVQKPEHKNATEKNPEVKTPDSKDKK